MLIYFNMIIESLALFLKNYTESENNLPKILIIGSSVAKGLGLRKSWAKQLTKNLIKHAYVTNLSIGGMNTSDALEQLNNVYDFYGKFDIVIVSLSLANEGFNDLIYRNYTRYEVINISHDYLLGINKIHELIKKKEGIPIICSVYPNSNFDNYLHQQSLFVKETMKNKYDHFIDFYTNVHKDGKWDEKHILDAGHPNNQGHKLMFEQIDIDYLIKLINSLK